MKPRILIIFTLVVIMLLACWVIASAQTSRISAASVYQVDTKLVTGEGYRLTHLTWEVSGALSGDRYQMLDPAAPTLTGSGCCCTYAPCVLRK
jgi:hypothetical protein